MPRVSATQNRASVRFDSFKGLRQGGAGVDVNPSLALEAVNVATADGLFASSAAHLKLPLELGAPIGTLAYLYRRWTDDPDQGVFVAASAGRLYWAHPDDAEWTLCGGASGFQSDAWSFAAYEINPEGSAAPVDVLLISNALDGLHMVRGDTFECEALDAPKKPGVISRYSERIWGAAFADDPDMLMYCAPYNPGDWTLNAAHPEDGAGDVLQPSWDGDAFTALVAFGSQLLAFKKRRVWRVLGVNPGEFAMKEQYGGGAEFPGTVVPIGAEVLMLGRESLERYDGMDVSMFGREFVAGVFRSMNLAAAPNARAALHEGVYYVALPVRGADVNNAVLSYNTLDGTWMVWEDTPVAAWLETEEGLFFTSAKEPGRVFRWRAGSEALPLAWRSGWFEFERADAVKENFEVLMQASADAIQHVTVSIITDRMGQAKEICVRPPFPGRDGPNVFRETFGVRGRRWRLGINAPRGPMWSMPSVTVQMDINED